MNDVYINKDMLLKLSHNGFATYLALKKYMDSNVKISDKISEYTIYTSIEHIMYLLFDTMEFDTKRKTDKIKSDIKQGFNELLNYNILTLLYKCNTNYIVDIRNMIINIDNGKTYYKTNTEEIKTIMSIETTHRFNFLHYAQTLLSTIWTNSGKYGCNSINDLCFESGINKSQALSYNNLLEDNKIIYISRNDTAFRNNKGQLQSKNNTYGRYEDKALIEQKSNNYNYKSNTLKLDSNLKRSINAKYKSYLKGGYKGDVDKLILECEKYNTDYYIAQANKQLDLSIFNNTSKNKE